MTLGIRAPFQNHATHAAMSCRPIPPYCGHLQTTFRKRHCRTLLWLLNTTGCWVRILVAHTYCLKLQLRIWNRTSSGWHFGALGCAAGALNSLLEGSKNSVTSFPIIRMPPTLATSHLACMAYLPRALKQDPWNPDCRAPRVGERPPSFLGCSAVGRNYPGRVV